MGPGVGLIVGVPFLVATLSLLWLFRRERYRREAGLPASRVFRFYQAIAAVILVLVGLEVVGLVYVALTERPARQPEPLATWPVAPEVLASPVSSGLPPNFDGGGWALDPTFGAPGPATTTLHILVWDPACSSGAPTTGRMSAPVVVSTRPWAATRARYRTTAPGVDPYRLVGCRLAVDRT